MLLLMTVCVDNRKLISIDPSACFKATGH